MAAAVYVQPTEPMAPLISQQHALSIDEVIVAPNQTIVVGQVLGAAGITAQETISSSAGSNNSGNGAIGPITTSTAATNGPYEILLLGTGSTAPFSVTRPDGTLDGSGKVGSPYTGQINFTLSAGGVAFAAGDFFTIDVTRPFGEVGEQFEAWNPAATDGSQNAAAIALYPATTGAGQTAKIAALRRDGTARLSDLTWNASATPQQTAFATQQLAAKNIVLR